MVRLVVAVFTAGLCWQSVGADRVFPAEIQTTLKASCYQCHGDKGEKAGRFESILDLEELIRNKKVIPGNAKDSPLIVRVKRTGSSRMPPPEDYDGKALSALSATQIASLEKFINGLSATAETKPVTTGKEPKVVEYEDVQNLIIKDLQTAKNPSRTRYFTFFHLDEADAAKAKRAVGAWINFLSWGKAVVLPAVVPGSDNRLVRIDLNDYGWSDAHWAMLVHVYPYTMSPRTGLDDNLRDNEKKLSEKAGAAVPFVKGDWFLSATATPPLYHELLVLPKTRRELQVLLDASDTSKQLRAGFKHSLVAFHNRNIAVSDGRFGTYWETFDFDLRETVAKTNLFERPLDSSHLIATKNANEIFSQAGGEIIFSLPNGLHGYYVVDALGTRIDQAPFHVANHPRVPTEIATGQTCLVCHSGGLVSFKDELHEFAVNRFARDLISRDTLATVKKLHGDQEALLKKYKDVNSTFGEQEAKLGLGKEGLSEVLSATKLYNRRIKLPQLERELGRTKGELLSEERLEAFRRARRESGKNKFESLFSLAESSGMSRGQFEREFKSLAELAHLGTPPVFVPLVEKTFLTLSSSSNFDQNFRQCVADKARMLRPADLDTADVIDITSRWSRGSITEDRFFINDPKVTEDGVVMTPAVTVSLKSGNKGVFFPAPSTKDFFISAGNRKLKTTKKLGPFDLFRLVSSLGTSLQTEIFEENRVTATPFASTETALTTATQLCVQVNFDGKAALARFGKPLSLPKDIKTD